jgi:hypothetical protein
MNFKKLRAMNTIKGSGNTSLREQEVSSFIHLHVAINAKGNGQAVQIELYPSEEEKVIFETDTNLVRYFSAVNLGRTLFVASDAGYRNIDFTMLKIKVYLRQLARLQITCDNFKLITANRLSSPMPLELKILGVGNADIALEVPVLKALFQVEGNIALQGNCEEAQLRTHSIGNLLAKDFVVQKLKVKNMSEGFIEVHAEKSIEIFHGGEGNVHYYGNAKLNDVVQRGEGLIQHKELTENAHHRL